MISPSKTVTEAADSEEQTLSTSSLKSLTSNRQRVVVQGPSGTQTTLSFLPPISLTSSSYEDAQGTSSKEPSVGQTHRASNRCACSCVAANHSHTAEAKAELVIKELLLQKSALSKQTRKYNSAQDWRPSAIVTGGVGVVCLVVFVALVVTPDVGPVVRFLYRYIKLQCAVH
ncbi:uncharacterized protein LOC112559549 [Pomacea canaliculata]|uniref:uncharacterized protein LOC112559549 n=1 Tax=Pomacea canaliculata TaxID=400727 RepID=UPI000D732523|nr:uncharacterized protein LOC112559549 [Pomacea canaliculata]